MIDNCMLLGFGLNVVICYQAVMEHVPQNFPMVIIHDWNVHPVCFLAFLLAQVPCHMAFTQELCSNFGGFLADSAIVMSSLSSNMSRSVDITMQQLLSNYVNHI